MTAAPLSITRGDQTPPHTPTYRNQAAQRVLAVLSAFNGITRPLGVTELALQLGMSKNMVHRALTTLVSEGFLVRDAGGQRYQLGYRVLALGPAGDGEFDIAAMSRPTVQRLHDVTGESIFLSIIVGPARVTIDEILPPGPRILRSSRGAPVPLHCTKMSRVLLAHLSDAEIDSYLASAEPLDRNSRHADPQSLTREAIWHDIAGIRAAGDVLWRNPHTASAAYAIFPILDAAGRPHAIVTVGGPRDRFDLERIEQLAPQLAAILQPMRDHARLFAAPHPSWTDA
jgi:DNA-binding IclR family transcriptional regulator